MEHIKNRLEFAKKWGKLLDGNNGKLYYCFLDEKWFYTTSRRRKFKILPRATFESLKESFFIPKKIRSRRHACKVMFLGVVAPPIDTDEIKTDGKI